MKNLKACWFLLALVCLNASIVYSLKDAPIVTTKYGDIKGVSDDLANKYLGIPYALPPVGQLRWTEPLRAMPWYPQVLNATSLKPACPQYKCAERMPAESCPPSISEDCLYLNVFTPLAQSKDLKPVMLFIHGGNFQYQGANSPLFAGQYMTNATDTIVVIFQYRLGALGYLVTGLEADQFQGNFGIKDQRMAIKWVYDNIAAFGGDPTKITLFGQSAGGESTTIHLLSADMQEYIQNAIIQSSPMSIPFRSFADAMAIYSEFHNTLNCSYQDILCLRSKSIDDILVAQLAVDQKVSSLRLLGFFEPWLPWVDGTLIKGQLLDIPKWQKPTNFTIKPFVIGSLTEECVIYIYLAWTKPLSSQLYGELMLAAFKQDALKILDRFPPTSNPDQRDLTSKVATEWVFGCSARNFLESAILYSAKTGSNNKFYQYVYDFSLDFNGWDNFTICYKHVCHGSDMPYTFDSADDRFTINGRNLAQSHMAYWTNFAKYNSPNAPSGSDGLLNWPSYDMSTKNFLRFQSPANTIESAYLKSDCDFFDSIGYYH